MEEPILIHELWNMDTRIEFDAARNLVNFKSGNFCIAQMPLVDYGAAFGVDAVVVLMRTR